MKSLNLMYYGVYKDSPREEILSFRLIVTVVTDSEGSDLGGIRSGLEELQEATNPRRFGSSMRGIFLYVENGKKIKGYASQLSWAMDVFQVS